MGHFRGTPFGDPFWTNSRPGIWRGKAQIHSIVRLDDLGAIRNPPKMGQFGGSLHSVSLSRARAKVYTRASLHPGADLQIWGSRGVPGGLPTVISAKSGVPRGSPTVISAKSGVPGVLGSWDLGSEVLDLGS